MKIKKNTSLSEDILELGLAIMKLKKFDDYSEFVSALIREEADRRGLIAVNSQNADAPSETLASENARLQNEKIPSTKRKPLRPATKDARQSSAGAALQSR